MIGVREDLKSVFPEKSLDEFFRIDGETVKHVVASRRIFRFERDGRHFYMKVHYGVGWAEIFKNLLHFKMPVLGAENEWLAIRAFADPAVNIATTPLAAWGKQGWNPAAQRSFIITDAIENTEDLEHWLPQLQQHPDQKQALRLKRAVIAHVAGIAKRLHGNGMNHRDFYLCHFRIAVPEQGLPELDKIQLYLMDLHRVQRRSTVPHRWVVKDIAGLFFSALYDSRELSLTRGDILRFIEGYTGQPWRQALQAKQDFWQDVIKRILRTYKHDHGNKPVLPNWIEHIMSNKD